MGRNWVIAIGINEYENLSPLKYAKQDAEAMAAWFKQEAKFDKDYVFLFTEDSPPIDKANPPIPTEPTYGHLRRFLRAQFENRKKPLLKPGDNLWFFFAGHGERHRDQDYLMLSDSDPGDVEHTAISVEYVTQRLRRSGADNVVLFLDACRDESRGGLGIGEEEYQGVITFYSCTANQKSWEVDELQHGSFTYALLEGLQLQGEANCATVERLDQYLCYQVPKLNSRYKKPSQNPYLKAEPPYKMYFILLEQSATLKDVEPLKYQASLAENKGNLLLAEQLWIRILAVSRGDFDAIAAIQRIAVKKIIKPQDSTQKSVISTPETATLPRGEGVEASETEIQKKEQHQQNLVQYRRSFSQAVEQKFPLSESSLSKLRNLQQSLQLTEEEVSQIQQPIIAQKEAEQRKRREAERIRQQKEAERLQRQREEAERQLLQQQEIQRRRLQEEAVTKPVPISRKQFLKWAGLGSAGLLTAVVAREIFKEEQPSTLVAELDYFKFETVTVDQKGEIVERDSNKQAKFFKEDLGNGVTLDMVAIPGGKFLMGTEDEEIERLVKKFDTEYFRVEKPQHEVTVQPFFMGKYLITQAQYQQVMGKNPSHFKGDDRPVEQVSWDDAVEFCQRLSKQTGREYRLPLEAEWEYACRAGTTTSFHFGETITTDLANYDGNYTYANEPKGEFRQQTTPVGSFPPNAFGLYDMHGNVWEWCQDDWQDNYEGASKDGSARTLGAGSNKVVRGGSWYFPPIDCRSAFRVSLSRDDRSYIIGFRVVRVAPRTT